MRMPITFSDFALSLLRGAADGCFDARADDAIDAAVIAAMPWRCRAPLLIDAAIAPARC